MPGYEILGAISFELKDFKQAAEYWEYVLKHYKKNDGQKLKLLRNLGNAYYQSGDLEKPLDCYKQALALSETLEPQEISNIRSVIGQIYQELGKHDKSAEYKSESQNKSD